LTLMFERLRTAFEDVKNTLKKVKESETGLWLRYNLKRINHFWQDKLVYMNVNQFEFVCFEMLICRKSIVWEFSDEYQEKWKWKIISISNR
jgi:hypothetical protein